MPLSEIGSEGRNAENQPTNQPASQPPNHPTTHQPTNQPTDGVEQCRAKQKTGLSKKNTNSIIFALAKK